MAYPVYRSCTITLYMQGVMLVYRARPISLDCVVHSDDTNGIGHGLQTTWLWINLWPIMLSTCLVTRQPTVCKLYKLKLVKVIGQGGSWSTDNHVLHHTRSLLSDFIYNDDTGDDNHFSRNSFWMAKKRCQLFNQVALVFIEAMYNKKRIIHLLILSLQEW